MSIPRQILLTVLVFALFGTSYAAIEKLDWEKCSLEGSGVSLELPFPFGERTSEETTKEGVLTRTVSASCSRYPDDFTAFNYFKRIIKTLLGIRRERIFFVFDSQIHYTYISSDKNYFNSQQIIDRYISAFSKAYQERENKNLQVKQKPFQRPGLSGILLTESYDAYRKGFFYHTYHRSEICVVKEKQMWQFTFSYGSTDPNADSKEAGAAIQHIIDSIKIEPPKP